jgi:phenylacetate-CoA ligase
LVVPASSGAVTPTVRQLEFVRRFGVTAGYWTATYSRIMAAAAEAAGLVPADLGVRRIVGLGEVISPATRQQIEDVWNAKAYDLYGTMETMAWSSVDCQASRESGGALGMHIWSDALIVEILDENGQVCASGEYGDLTFTSWVSMAGPKFRYRMGDRAALWTDPCPCGLKTPRLSPLAGRVDDMLRINGQSIWPSAIEAILRRAAPEVGDWVAVASRNGPRDVLTLQVEAADGTGQDMATRLAAEFKGGTGVKPDILVLPPGATSERSGAGTVLKAKRIFDER